MTFSRIFKKDPEDTIVGLTSQCDTCAYRIHGTTNCEAYSKGIPLPIFAGAWDHIAEYPGDGGLRYTPAD